MTRFLVGLWLAVLVAVSPAAAQQYPARPAGPILDQAGLLTPAQTIDLTGKLTAFNDRTGRALVVATVESLGGQEIAPYAVQLGRQWGIGGAKDDVGVLLLVAPTERKVWIATGYGGDDYLTDAVSGTIIRDQILPRFKAGDMGGGIIAGVDAIIKQLELPPEEAARRAREIEQRAPQRSEGDFSFLPVIFFMIIAFMILSGFRRGRGGRRYHRRSSGGIDPMVVLWGLDAISRASRGSRGGWGSGGFGGFGGGGGGGGFGGFGGGSFGGGGAGGSW